MVQMSAPRAERMPVDQDWASVWPTARSLVPSAVPLPLRMGYVAKPWLRQPPDKYANLELIKVPNFLHLTPPAVARHCAAIKKFCTPWPEEELDTDEKLTEAFPVEYSYSDYCHAGTNLRDPRSRIVAVKVHVAALQLSRVAREKLIRLVGQDRYDADTDVITIVCDRCPMRQQNKEYADYLLTVLYKECCKTEAWETQEMTRDDAFHVTWTGSKANHVLDELNARFGAHTFDDPEALEGYKSAWEGLQNGAEDVDKVEQYGDSVKKLLGLTKPKEEAVVKT